MLVEVAPARSRENGDAADVSEMLESVARALKIDGDHLRAEARFAPLCQLVQDMMLDGRDRTGPVRESQARLGDKWSSLLLFLLRAGPFRHSTLRRLVSVTAVEQKISQRMLTLRLRNLERDGFIRRQIDQSVPPRVEYSLTPLGRSFADRAMALVRWVGDHAEEMQRARTAFDEQHHVERRR